MAKVQFILEKGESLEEAENMLLKAMNHHIFGEVHKEEKFDDPAMQDSCAAMDIIHRQIYSDMLDEIFQALEGQYRGDF